MRVKPKTTSALGLCVLVAGVSTAMAADPIASPFIKYTIGDGGLMWSGLGLSIDGHAESGGVGGIQITKDSSFNPSQTAGFPSTYVTVCTDVRGTLYLGTPYTYDLETFIQDGHTGWAPQWGASAVDDMPATAVDSYAAIHKAAAVFYNTASTVLNNAVATTIQKAGVQLAIWEALYDTAGVNSVDGVVPTRNPSILGQEYTTADFTANGRFLATATSPDAQDAIDYAVDYLNAVYTTTKDTWLLYPNPDVVGTYKPQGLLIEDKYVPTPEPATVIAGLFLGIPFAFSTVRVLLKKRTA